MGLQPRWRSLRPPLSRSGRRLGYLRGFGTTDCRRRCDDTAFYSLGRFGTGACLHRRVACLMIRLAHKGAARAGRRVGEAPGPVAVSRAQGRPPAPRFLSPYGWSDRAPAIPLTAAPLIVPFTASPAWLFREHLSLANVPVERVQTAVDCPQRREACGHAMRRVLGF